MYYNPLFIFFQFLPNPHHYSLPLSCIVSLFLIKKISPLSLNSFASIYLGHGCAPLKNTNPASLNNSVINSFSDKDRS